MAAVCLKLGGWGLFGCLVVTWLFFKPTDKARVVKVAKTRRLK